MTIILPIKYRCFATSNLFVATSRALELTLSCFLFKLNLETFEWEKLEVRGRKCYGSDKQAAILYKGRIYLFGGNGRRSESVRENGVDFENWGTCSWNNQLVSCFFIYKKKNQKIFFRQI